MTYPMRVNQNSADTLLVSQLDSSLGRLQNLEQETASGLAITEPSDNPTGTASALELNSQISAFNAYGAAASDGQSWLTAADSTLSSVGTALQQVQTTLMTAANTSANDPATLASLASTVQATKQTLLQEASTAYGSGYLFSGTWATPPYANAASGDYTYTGSSTAQYRTVGPGQQVPVTAVGSSVFGSGTTSVFALLDTISSDISSGNASALSGTDLSSLKAAMATVSTAQADLGVSADTLQTVQTNITAKVAALQTSVSGIVDADEATVASQFQLADVQYQAALAAASKVVTPTLASYLS